MASLEELLDDLIVANRILAGLGVAHVLPLHAFDELAAFFAGFMIDASGR